LSLPKGLFQSHQPLLNPLPIFVNLDDSRAIAGILHADKKKYQQSSTYERCGRRIWSGGWNK
jgi:hypothetical protein